MNQGARAIFGDRAGIFNADAAKTGHINAGLHGNHMANFQNIIAHLGKPGIFMDINAHRMAQTVTMLEKVEGVEMIDAEFELAEGFTTLSKVLGLVSTGIIAILLIVSLLIISNTVKLAMYDRRTEIGIMKMVGATNGFIRFPFIIQGFCLGILGAGLAFSAVWLLYDMLVTNIRAVDALGLFSFVPFEQLLTPMVVTFTAAGLFVGVFGSISAIRKFMDV